MEIDTSNLTDEQISKLGEFVRKMEEENKATKWWIMPKYTPFTGTVDFEKYGPCYYVEPQKDIYSRSQPPLKSGFESKESAEKWLKDYLAEEDLFSKAIDEINTLKNNLGSLMQKLRNHQYITNTDINKCFESFNNSWDKGSISRVIKTETVE